MRIRNLILLVMVGVLILISVIFSFFFYQTLRQALESKIDRELFTAATMAKEVLPVHYHDKIVGSDSVTDVEYLQIVERFNSICKQTGMEYLWSLLILDGKIVFTSGTSPGKDAARRDQASFLEVHSNPELYVKTFETMQPQFQVSEDRWGRIRVVLLPFYDAQGRKFLVGASRRMQEVDAQLQNLLNSSLLLGSGMILLGILISFVLANSLARPIDELKKAASKIAAGDFTSKISFSGLAVTFSEVTSLANSFELLKQAVNNREESLRKSEEKFRSIAEQTNDLIALTDANGLITYASPASRDIFHWAPEEMCDRRFVDLLDEPAIPEATAAFRALLERGERTKDLKLAMKRKDGSVFVGEVNGSVFRNNSRGEALVVIRDITKRYQAEKALQESEAKYRRIIDTAQEGICVVDMNMLVAFVNPRMAVMLGYDPSEMTGQPVERFICKDDLPDHFKRIEERKQGHGGYFERRYQAKDGRAIWTSVSATTLVDNQGQFAGSFGMITDITERKRVEKQVHAAQMELSHLLEESERSRRALLGLVEDQKEAQGQIRRLNTELEQRVQERTAQLEAVNRELEAFSYSVSHDLRAPLRALDGFSAALLEEYAGQLDAQAKDYLLRIQEAARRMAQLIEDLLNLSRVTRREFNLSSVNLSSIAQQIVDDLRSQSPDRRVEIEISPHLVVQADANLIKIALENLLYNAFKFTSKCELAHIQFGETSQSDKRVFFVRDNGAGFNMAYAKKLFMPFQRLHSANEYPGTGIGLTIVQRIITRHGGRIWTEAGINQGAVFYFTLENSEQG